MMNFFDDDKIIKVPDLKRVWEESIIETNDLNLNDDIKKKDVRVVRRLDYDERLGTFRVKYKFCRIKSKE